MKKRITCMFGVIVLLLFSATISVQAQLGMDDTGLLGYWSFENSAVVDGKTVVYCDLGKGKDVAGILNGAGATIANSNGVDGNDAAFLSLDNLDRTDATLDDVASMDFTTEDTKNFFSLAGKDQATIACWVKIPDMSIADQQVIIGYDNKMAQLKTHNSKQTWIIFYYIDATVKWAAATIELDVTNQQDTWVHITSTHNGTAGTNKFYINGALAASSIDAAPGVIFDDATVNETPLSFGKNPVPTNALLGNRFLNGQIDEVYIFERELTDQEIAALPALRPNSSTGINDVRTEQSTDVIVNYIDGQIRVKSELQANTLSLINMQGQVVSTKISENNSWEINADNFNKGMYIVKLTNNRGQFVGVTKVMMK